jgi:hypothetical protein
MPLTYKLLKFQEDHHVNGYGKSNMADDEERRMVMPAILTPSGMMNEDLNLRENNYGTKTGHFDRQTECHCQTC